LAAGTIGIEYKVKELAPLTEGGIDKVIIGCIPHITIAIGNPIIQIPQALLNVVNKLQEIAFSSRELAYKSFNTTNLLTRGPVIIVRAARTDYQAA
jgi:hypothetical protein